jgi:HD-like signal output (HDOD) protein
LNKSPNKLNKLSADKTMALLLDRARQQGDLPGFARAITAILGAMRGEDDREFNMTQTVLSDPALTQKVLRLSNSAMYSAFGQSIGTVSKAVIVLGTETIGHLALGLKLIDELSSASPDSAEAHLEMEKAVLAGQVARQVATSANHRDAEEAVVCSMLHTLGRMMTVFYLADRWAKIRERCSATGHSEETICTELLGLTLEEIGRITAERWGLPKHLIRSMRHVEPSTGDDPINHSDWLAALSTLAARCADALCEDESVGNAEIEKLSDQYAQMLGIDVKDMLEAIETVKPAVEEIDLSAVQSAKRRSTQKRSTRTKIDPRAEMSRVLTNGVSDMRDAAERTNPSQMMAMALETVFQGLKLSHAIAFLRNRKEGQYAAKMCFGTGAQELISRLTFDDAYQPDTFHTALSTDRIIYIENANDPKFAAKLPQWWKQSLSKAGSFIILPLLVNNHAAGFIYGDWEGTLPPMKFDAADFMLLNALRVLVVQSIDRRHRIESAAPR